MADWIHEGLPPLWSRAKVWLTDDSVRSVKTDVTMIGVGLFFTDCTDPLQNVICDRSRVKAWTPEDPHHGT